MTRFCIKCGKMLRDNEKCNCKQGNGSSSKEESFVNISQNRKDNVVNATHEDKRRERMDEIRNKRREDIRNERMDEIKNKRREDIRNEKMDEIKNKRREDIRNERMDSINNARREDRRREDRRKSDRRVNSSLDGKKREYPNERRRDERRKNDRRAYDKKARETKDDFVIPNFMNSNNRKTKEDKKDFARSFTMNEKKEKDNKKDFARSFMMNEKEEKDDKKDFARNFIMNEKEEKDDKKDFARSFEMNKKEEKDDKKDFARSFIMNDSETNEKSNDKNTGFVMNDFDKKISDDIGSDDIDDESSFDEGASNDEDDNSYGYNGLEREDKMRERMDVLNYNIKSGFMEMMDDFGSIIKNPVLGTRLYLEKDDASNSFWFIFIQSIISAIFMLIYIIRFNSTLQNTMSKISVLGGFGRTLLYCLAYSFGFVILIFIVSLCFRSGVSFKTCFEIISVKCIPIIIMDTCACVLLIFDERIGIMVFILSIFVGLLYIAFAFCTEVTISHDKRLFVVLITGIILFVAVMFLAKKICFSYLPDNVTCQIDDLLKSIKTIFNEM